MGEKIVDVPVVKQVDVPQITTVEKVVEVPHTQVVEKVVEIPMAGQTTQGAQRHHDVPLPAIRQQQPAEHVTITAVGPDLPIEHGGVTVTTAAPTGVPTYGAPAMTTGLQQQVAPQYAAPAVTTNMSGTAYATGGSSSAVPGAMYGGGSISGVPANQVFGGSASAAPGTAIAYGAPAVATGYAAAPTTYAAPAATTYGG